LDRDYNDFPLLVAEINADATLVSGDASKYFQFRPIELGYRFERRYTILHRLRARRLLEFLIKLAGNPSTTSLTADRPDLSMVADRQGAKGLSVGRVE
jgi:hypothetical protein